MTKIRVRNFENGDMVTSGQLFVTDQKAVQSLITSNTKLFKGENLYNKDQGIDYFDVVLGRTSSDVEGVNREFLICWSNTTGVQTIAKYDSKLDKDSRKVIVTGEIISDFGTFKVNEES